MEVSVVVSSFGTSDGVKPSNPLLIAEAVIGPFTSSSFFTIVPSSNSLRLISFLYT